MHIAANAIRKSFPDKSKVVIWTNEATPVLDSHKDHKGRPRHFTLPLSISWFSIDMYHRNGKDEKFVGEVKKFYEKYVYPLMDP